MMMVEMKVPSPGNTESLDSASITPLVGRSRSNILYYYCTVELALRKQYLAIHWLLIIKVLVSYNILVYHLHTYNTYVT